MVAYVDDDITFFQARAARLKLSGPPEFVTMGWEQLAKICNGVGGKGSSLTPVINFIYAKYQTSAAIHDLRYWLGGTDDDRKAADKELLKNMTREWADYWGMLRWFRPMARAERRELQAAYLAVRNFGGRYFQHKEQ